MWMRADFSWIFFGKCCGWRRFVRSGETGVSHMRSSKHHFECIYVHLRHPTNHRWSIKQIKFPGFHWLQIMIH
jgi:hypothetical protein